MDAAPQRLQSLPKPTPAHPFVVKLGGSVVRGRHLESWLDVIAGPKQPIVVVPGGGALADEVRQCQRHLGFGDDTAHRMALLAMDQLAYAIAGLRPGFEVRTGENDLRTVLERGHIAVWAPSALIANRTDLEADWRLTSDSLALWLASRLKASACYVIKSAPLGRGPYRAASLREAGIVDEAFPSMLAETGVSAEIFGPGEEAVLTARLMQEATPSGHWIE